MEIKVVVDVENAPAVQKVLREAGEALAFAAKENKALNCDILMMGTLLDEANTKIYELSNKVDLIRSQEFKEDLAHVLAATLTLGVLAGNMKDIEVVNRIIATIQKVNGTADGS